jgi:hypothetical protein
MKETKDILTSVISARKDDKEENMNEKKFIGNFTVLIQKAVMLNNKRRKYGITSLEEEVEDLDDEDLKQGLRMIIDGTDIAIVDEVMSNKISFIKDKYESRYKTIIKRVVLGIQKGMDTRSFIFVLFSLANLPPKEQKEIEYKLFDMLDEPPPETDEDENTDAENLITDGLDEGSVKEIKKRLYDFDAIFRLDDRSIQKVFRELDTVDLAKALKAAGKKARDILFRNLSKRARAMIREDMGYMGPIHLSAAEESQQKIIDIIRRLEETGEIISRSDDLDLEG